MDIGVKGGNVGVALGLADGRPGARPKVVHGLGLRQSDDCKCTRGGAMWGGERREEGVATCARCAAEHTKWRASAHRETPIHLDFFVLNKNRN